MPIYQVDIEKSLTPGVGNTVYWTNVYHVQASDITNAIAAGNGIVTIEKQAHGTIVSYTKMRVQQTSPIAMSGTIVPLSGTGARSSSNPMPLFNVFRVDFNVGGGRPSRKYLRAPVLTTDNSSGALVAGTITFLNTSYITPLVALGTVVDPQGQAFQSGAPYPLVGMRQLRRGSKRKTTPVL